MNFKSIEKLNKLSLKIYREKVYIKTLYILQHTSISSSPKTSF